MSSIDQRLWLEEMMTWRGPGAGRLLTAVFAVTAGMTLVAGNAFAAPVTITSGTAWKDTAGTSLQAHGGGMIKVGSTYYWFGEDKTGLVGGNANFLNVKCYSSTDLARWKFERNVLTRQGGGELGPNRIIERPKVIFNRTTNQYVMYMHVDTPPHTDTKVGVATSSSVCGSYSYRGSTRPMGFRSLDIGLFQESDGKAYLISESRTDGLRMYQLSSDYLRVERLIHVFEDFESPAMIKIGNRYYLFGSRKTGWRTNDNRYTTSTSLTSGWASWQLFAPAGTRTHNSQTTFVLPVAGSQTTTYMFMGDRWIPDSLGDSRYVWLPLTIQGTKVTMPWHARWTIDTATGRVTF